MIEYKSDELKAMKQSLIKTKKTFIIEKKRNTTNIISNNKIVGICRDYSVKNNSRELKKQIITLFGQVQKQVNKHIVEQDFNIPTIIQNNSPVFSNYPLYNSLKTDESFFYVDIKHCYWRIAFLQGLITEKLYEAILLRDDMKIFRNMSLSCIVAPKSREYYSKGKLIQEIEEDREIYQTIYNNIRFTAYNLMGEIQNKLGNEFLIGYRTDAIICLEDVLADVTEVILKNNFDYRVNECFKVDNKHFKYDNGEIKQF